MSSDPWCERFIAAFNTHEVAPMQALSSPDITWEDVSGHISFEGHEGVKNMVEITLMTVPNCAFAFHGGMREGARYMVEWTMSGTAFGIEFACRGASVGELDDQDRIVHNRDYWDSRSFPMMPGGPENPELKDLQEQSHGA